MRTSKSFILYFLFSFSIITFGQGNNSVLSELDSLAFSALENNGKNVTQLANKLLLEAEKQHSPLHQINANTILGIVNKNKGHYVTAVDYYEEALEVAIQTNDEGRISACYNNIGSVYQIQENYSKAIDYFKKSLAIEDRLNNPLQKSIRLYNIGDMYREMDSLSLALTNFNSSLLIEKELNNTEGMVYALLGVSDIYLRLKKKTDARIVLEESSQYVKDSGLEIQILYNLLNAELLKQEGKLKYAAEELSKARSISEENQFKVHLVDIYEKEIEINKMMEAVDRSNDLGDNTLNLSQYLIWFLILLLIIVVLLIFFVQRRKKLVGKAVIKSTDEKLFNRPLFRLENDAGKVLLEIEINRIICFEANDNYVITYYLSKEDDLIKSMERSSLKRVSELIADIAPEFYRVHKSFIVNRNFVETVVGKSQAYKVRMRYMEDVVPVSRSFEIELIKG